MTAAKTSDRSLVGTARLAGALNALSALPDGFAITTLRKLVVRGDASATAANIIRAEGMFRLAFVADLVGLLLFIGSGVLLYDIFKAASRRLALLFLVFFLGGALIQALNSVQDVAALLVLKGGPGLSALPPAHANALAFLFLKLHSSNFVLALFFGGCSSVVMGFLILKSTFVPRFLGPCMFLDGLGYLTFSLTTFLVPALHVQPYVPYGTAIGEGVFYIWLIVKGVNAERWREQAAVAGLA